MYLFRYLNTLPCAQNLKPKFEFQTPLARNSPAGTSELITFGANSDLRRNCKLRRNCLAGTSELIPFGANSDLPWEWKLPDISSRGLLFAFSGASELIPFGANSDIFWNCSAGNLELIHFGASSDLLWDLWLLEIPSWGFLLAFPRWGLICLFVRGELHISPLGFYYTSTFLENYTNRWLSTLEEVNPKNNNYCIRQQPFTAH